MNVEYLLLFSVFANLVYLSNANNCNSLPVSISDAFLCSDGVCTFNQLANVAIPASEGSTSCNSFKSPDKNIPDFTVNITVVSSYYRFDSTDCYFTDDPAVQSKGFCGCPGGTPSSCPVCPNSIVNGNNVLCTSGTHNDPDCFAEWLGFSGTYCLNTGLSAFKRFKVCKYGALDHVIELSVKLSNTNVTFLATYSGEPAVFNNPATKANISIISLDSQVKYVPEFSVLDLHSPNTVYLLKSDVVNGPTEYDPRKIGFIKPGKSIEIPYAIQSEIDVRIVDCNTNTFAVTYPWTNVAKMLTQSQDKTFSAVIPNSIYMDSDVDGGALSVDRQPVHSTDTSVNVGEGLIGYTTSNSLYYAGVTYDNTLINPQTIRMTGYWDGDSTNSTEINCQCSCTPTGVAGACLCLGSTCLVQATLLANKIPDFWCVGTYAVTIPCTNNAAGPTLFLYPHHKQVTIHSWNGNINQTLVGQPDTSVTILEDIGNGVINVQLQFKNFTIGFEHTTVLPKISNLYQDHNEVKATIKSLTNPGICFASSEPAGFIHANSINLALVNAEFTFPLALNRQSDFTFVVRCYDKVDSKLLSVTKFEDDADAPIEGATVRNPVDYFFSPGHLVGDLDDAFDSNPVTHWANTLIAIAFWVLIAAAALLIIYGLVKLILYRRMSKKVVKPFVKMR